VAWTLADLRGAPGPERCDIAEAVEFKGFTEAGDGPAHDEDVA
jgi:magnesium chelatase family protein